VSKGKSARNGFYKCAKWLKTLELQNEKKVLVKNLVAQEKDLPRPSSPFMWCKTVLSILMVSGSQVRMVRMIKGPKQELSSL